MPTVTSLMNPPNYDEIKSTESDNFKDNQIK